MAIRKLPEDVRSLLQSSFKISSYCRAVEELVYNSLDSEATSIAVRVNLKKHTIEVIDNGTAISENNLKLVGLRHMTNKYCSSTQNQKSNLYYGYQGTAIASIVDISLEVIIITKHGKSKDTYERQFYRGKVQAETNAICKMRPSKGTTVKIKGFMYNLTVRRNAINILTEMDEIKKCLENIAVIHPAISFSLRDDTSNNLLVTCPKCKDIGQRIDNIFGYNTHGVLEELKVEKNQIKIEGFFCDESKKTGAVNLQHVYVNKRLLFNSKIHKIINSLVKIKDKDLMDQKIKDVKNQKFTTWVNQEKVHLPYIIIISCPYNSYDLSFVQKKTLVEFHNWDLITNCLKKLVEFYLDISDKIVDKNAENVPNMEQKEPPQKLSPHKLQDIQKKYDKANETILSLINRVLKNNNNKKFGVSQLKNGVKGKAVKRKIVSGKSIKQKKVLVNNKNKPILQQINETFMENPVETPIKSKIGTLRIDIQSKMSRDNEDEPIVESMNRICAKGSIISRNGLLKTSKNYNKKNIILKKNIQELLKINNKVNVAVKEKSPNRKMFETYSAKQRFNEISKRFNHLMLKRRSEYLNMGVKKIQKSHERHVYVKENKNITMYKNNKMKCFIQDTSGQMFIRDFIPFEKYINYRGNLKSKLKICHKRGSELKPKTNYDLLKPMVQEELFRKPEERIGFGRVNVFKEPIGKIKFDERNMFGKPMEKIWYDKRNELKKLMGKICLGKRNGLKKPTEKNCSNEGNRRIREEFVEKDDLYRKFSEKTFKFDSFNKRLNHVEYQRISNEHEGVISYIDSNKSLNYEKVSNSIFIENLTTATSQICNNFSKSIDSHVSSINLNCEENNIELSEVGDSFDAITWSSHPKYNMEKAIYTNSNKNMNFSRFVTQETSPIVKPSGNLEYMSSYNENGNLNYNAAKKWGNFEFLESQYGVNEINRFGKISATSRIVKENNDIFMNLKNTFTNIHEYSKLTQSQNDQKQCEKRSEPNKNISTITSSEKSTIINVENHCFPRNYPQTLYDKEKIISNNIEVLFLSICSEDSVTNIKKDNTVEPENSPEASCIKDSIIPSQLCEVVLESSNLFEETAQNLYSNLPNTEKLSFETQNMPISPHEKRFIRSENDISGNSQENGLNTLDNRQNITETRVEKNINHILNNEIEYISESDEIFREIQEEELKDNAKVIEINENFTTNPKDDIPNEQKYEFQVVKRPNYFPKGMSPIVNKAVESVTLRQNIYANNSAEQAQGQYFNESTYEAFVQDVEKHTIAFQSEAQRLDEMTSGAIHNARLQMRNNLSSMVFHADSIKTIELLKQVDAKFVAVIIEGECSDKRVRCLALFDQHAVHERIRLEVLCAGYKDGNNWRSSKCDPFSLRMSSLQISQMFHYRDKFSDIGLHFVLNQETSDDILIVAVPMCVYSKEQKEQPGILHDTVKALVDEQLEVLRVTKGSGSSNPKTIMDLVNMEACRYAIKFGTQLSVSACVRLVRQLCSCVSPFQCAHGRPSMAPLLHIQPPDHQYKVDKAKLKLFSRNKNLV